ncbi:MULTISPECIES: AAA family ATPase [Olivibacter]|uniref:AAA family ATPase n=1 Tax=Olivibacter jilunii TaxID=985016 RepID=A0ABW6AVA0_9SPHI
MSINRAISDALCSKRLGGQIMKILEGKQPIADFGAHISDDGLDCSIEALKSSFQINTAGDLLARNIREIPTLLDGFFPSVGLVLLAGSSDAGKSMFTRNLAINLCAGRDEYIGFKFNPIHRKAIVVCSEDDDLAISYVLNRQTKNFTPDEKKNLNDSLQFIFDSEELIENIEAILKRQPVDLIVIDTLGDLINDIKDNSEMRKYLTKFRKLTLDHRCLILLMHHTNKKTEHLAPSKSNIMGAAGLEQKVRLALELRSDSNNPDYKHLSVLKGNYLSKEYKNASYVLAFNEEDFTFSNTGDRVDFDNLVTQEPNAKKPDQRKLPDYSEIDIEELKGILRPTFNVRKEGYLTTQLIPIFASNLKAHFNLPKAPGRDKVTEFIERLKNDGVLDQRAKSGRYAQITFNDVRDE